MMNILFVVPMHMDFNSFINPGLNARSMPKADGKYYNSLPTDLPLGPLSMSAYLKRFVNVNVKLIDFNAELTYADRFDYSNFHDYCVDFMRAYDFKPDLVCVSSLFSPSFDCFIDIARASREVFPQAMILGGGNIPTTSYKYIYEKFVNSFDALCIGEGEKPLLGLVQSENPRDFVETSPSWVTAAKMRRSGAGFTPSQDLIVELDEIPFYDYDLCDLDKHGLNPVITGFNRDVNSSLTRDISPGFNSTGKSNLSFHVMSSRGCPFRCTFCASHRTHGRDMRYHSVERMREDLTRLRDKHGATTVVFQDDHLMGDKDRVYKILEIIGDLKLEALFQSGLALYALDRPMLDAFYAAGVRHLVLAVESGSERVLKEVMHKPLKFHISERVAADCRDLGIYTNTNILIGSPGETLEDIAHARRNLRGLKTNWFNINCTSPLDGSEMHELALRKGYIPADAMGSDYHKAVISTEDFSSDDIARIQYEMNLELNFVHNCDMRLGEYRTALRGLANVIRIRPEHAFAHYFAAICYSALGEEENYIQHRDAYLENVKLPLWRGYAEMFELESAPPRHTDTAIVDLVSGGESRYA
jgi:radical SAM superfamily enzyme YgiQ (UPF0313 family)